MKSGQSIGAVAKELGLIEQTLRNWVKAAKAGKLHPPGAKAMTPEQMELSRVRAENAWLRMENLRTMLMALQTFPGERRASAH